jgi:hypothetical protein
LILVVIIDEIMHLHDSYELLDLIISISKYIVVISLPDTVLHLNRSS